MNKTLVIILAVAVVIVTMALAFGGYVYMRNMNKEDNSINQVDDSKSTPESDRNIQPITPDEVDNEVDLIIDDMEEEMIDIDFEDFDAELEFGY